jgi:hypothetical protein
MRGYTNINMYNVAWKMSDDVALSFVCVFERVLSSVQQSQHFAQSWVNWYTYCRLICTAVIPIAIY